MVVVHAETHQPNWERAKQAVLTDGLAIVHGPSIEAVAAPALEGPAEFTGWTRPEWAAPADGAVAIHRSGASPAKPSVLAVVTAYNEADIIRPSLLHMLDDGLRVHVIDNWSTDGTLDLVHDLGTDLVTTERFPSEGAPDTYEWDRLLQRVEEVAASSSADWIVHHDADERRCAPWPGMTLQEGIGMADGLGYSAVGHTEFLFQPTDDSFQAGEDFEAYFRHFAPSPTGANRTQIKAWKNVARVDLRSSAGHEARFAGRAVFPYNFLLKHYPIRSQHHGEQKILRDRQARWNPEERAKGWHTHYDHVRRGHTFVKRAQDLTEFTDATHAERLIERLSALGMAAAGPSPARTRAIVAFRRTGLLAPALAARRAWRIARRRHAETGR